MRIDIVTLFPGMVEPVLGASMLGRARARGLVDIRVLDLRDYAKGKHRIADDYQFGGGGGMVLKPEPLFAAVEALRTPGARVILLDPRGRTFTQKVAAELGRETHLILLAGRDEGVDARVSERLVDDSISIGDYVLTGGELPALVVTDAVARLLPGVLGAEGATERESFASGLLEPPQYTRPEEFQGARVPAVLLSGDHARIARWRRGAGARPPRRARAGAFKRTGSTIQPQTAPGRRATRGGPGANRALPAPAPSARSRCTRRASGASRSCGGAACDARSSTTSAGSRARRRGSRRSAPPWSPPRPKSSRDPAGVTPPSAPYRYEAQAWKTGVGRIAGVDDAGRGPLAGPVGAAAVVIAPDPRLQGLAHSKLLPPR